jgi:hypothetical protein
MSPSWCAYTRPLIKRLREAIVGTTVAPQEMSRQGCGEVCHGIAAETNWEVVRVATMACSRALWVRGFDEVPPVGRRPGGQALGLSQKGRTSSVIQTHNEKAITAHKRQLELYRTQSTIYEGHNTREGGLF